MKTRRLGRTELQVSELVFGGGWVGGLLIHGEETEKREALRRALAGGINWIDTAPLYGQGRSEEVLGELLVALEPQPLLSTKVRLDLEDGGDLPGQIERSLEASLKRLRRDSVALLQLHNPIGSETRNGTIGLEDLLRRDGAAEGLERLRERGLTRFIGLTALGEGDACRQAVESGRFDTAQVYYNLLNPSAGRALPAAWRGQDFSGLMDACRSHDVGVMAIRVLAAGVLASDRRHGREVVVTDDSDLELEERRAAAAFGALGLDADGNCEHGTRAQTALRFVLANPDLSCAVVGLAELGHLEEALAAAEMGPLPDRALAKLDAIYGTNFGLGT